MATFFTPGPAQLYPTFEKHLRHFLENDLGSISHRSQTYRDIHAFTVAQIRQLLNVPDSHAVLFLGSASEIWERIILSTVRNRSFHLVNGSFSKKFFQYAAAAGKTPAKIEKPLGEGFFYKELDVPHGTELLCITHNETSSGVQFPVEDIHRLKDDHPSVMLAVDMVSSAPYPMLDYNRVDTAFFSVQKAFGLPAGLGVWIVSEKCLLKANQLRDVDQISIGAHHDLPTLWKNAQKNETPATPNVMLIYLLGKIAEDMNAYGVERIRKETEEKAQLLYQFAENTKGFSPFVEEDNFRSKTVAVINTELPAQEIIGQLRQKGLIVGSGYGDKKSSQIRIANFPATNRKQIEQLILELANI